jgi:oligoendopeptidase F
MTATVEVLTRDQVPVEETWDLSRIYPDQASWDADAGAYQAAVEKVAQHRGHLADSPQRLKEAVEDVLKVSFLGERLFVYARLRSDEDTGDSAARGLIDRITALSIQAGEALAFFEPEILTMPAEELDAAIEHADLAPYRRMLTELRRRRAHTRSIEVEEVLAQTADLTRIPRDSFNVLDNADLDYGVVKDDEGKDVHLTKGRYQVLVESKDRETRRRAWEALSGEYLAHKNTLATLHASSVRSDAFQARVRNFSSAREAALFDDNVPAAVYDSLLSATRAAAPSIERYLNLRKRILGLDELHIYDLYVPLAPSPERKYRYDEAVQHVLDGVEALGERYAGALKVGFHDRWVDVHETKGKRSGAYSWGVYGLPPVMLMNWNGTLDHVFTLAHEAGHSMHSFLADAALPYQTAQYTIFIAEIASTLNEVLLTWHLLAQTPADDLEGRFSLLNRFADMIYGTLVRQAQYAEFEDRTHAVVESGEPLTLDVLNELYGDVFTAYNPGVVMDEGTRLSWGRVPHFYNAFYVFQYATGISAAIALASKIRDEGEPAARRFIELLESGGSDDPLVLLQRAGVDLTTPEPVEAALAEFDGIVREMERLVDQGALGS